MKIKNKLIFSYITVTLLSIFFLQLALIVGNGIYKQIQIYRQLDEIIKGWNTDEDLRLNRAFFLLPEDMAVDFELELEIGLFLNENTDRDIKKGDYIAIWALDNQGELIGEYPPQQFSDLLEKTRNMVNHNMTKKYSIFGRWRLWIIPDTSDENSRMTVVAVTDLFSVPASLWAEKGQFFTLQLIFLPFILFFGAVFGTKASTLFSGRIKNLEKAFTALEEKNFSFQLKDRKSDELGSLARQYTKTREALLQAMQTLRDMGDQKALLAEKEIDLAVYRERNRISRELHDGIKQSLFAQKLLIGTIENGNDSLGKNEHWKHLKEEIGKSQDDIVGLIENNSLIARSQETDHRIFSLLCESWELSAGLKINLDFKGLDSVTNEIVHDFYRITQESLANISRHSGSSEVDINIAVSQGKATLNIRDRGCGFNKGTVSQGNGLRNMRNRAEEAGGVFALKSTPGTGTEITVVLPQAKGANA